MHISFSLQITKTVLSTGIGCRRRWSSENVPGGDPIVWLNNGGNEVMFK